MKKKKIKDDKQRFMFKYRIYPSKKHIVKLTTNFKHCKDVWNELLGLNKKLMLTKEFDMNDIILDLKICRPEISDEVHAQVLQNVSSRLSKAFDNFFNRIELRKKGFKIKAGFPRFKRRVMSMTYPQKGYKIKNNNKLYISKIGTMPIILSRKIQGKIKTLTIKQNKASQWFAVFSCEIDKPKIKHPNQNIIGIDVGLKKFLTDQKGDTIVNPRFYIHAEKKLSMLQRIHSKRVKGSKNREKARIKVARQHLKVVNQRNDFLHKLTTNLTKNFGIICGERLNIKNMLRGYFAKYILDVSWGKFYQMLSYKAVICGGKLRKNKKLWSSCVCSRCGTWVNMPLSKRIFECSNPDCNLVLSRDQNSANNHIEDAEIGMDSAESTPVEMQPLPLCFAKISCVVESGTIFSTRRM